MSYSQVTPCCNYPSPTPEGQGDCTKKDTCADRHMLNVAVCAIHNMGPQHQGGGSITLQCFNKTVAAPQDPEETQP